MVIAICFTLVEVFCIVLSVGLASLCVPVRSSDADLDDVSSVVSNLHAARAVKLS